MVFCGTLHAADLDQPAVVLDDPLAQGEAEARTALLGREKRREDLLLDLLRHPRTFIAHDDLHRACRRGDAEQGGIFEGFDGAGRQPHTPRAAHRVGGVEHQIYQDLLQALGVAVDVGQVVVEVDDEVHLGEVVLHELGGAADGVVDAQRDKGAAKRSRVVEEFADHTVEPVHFVDDDFHQLAVVAFEDARVEFLSRPFDGRERISDLVGKAC